MVIPIAARRLGIITAIIMPATVATAQKDTTPGSPVAAVEALLSVDREFSRQSSRSNVAAALPAMFSDEVVMPQPGGKFAEGRGAVIDALTANPVNRVASATWTPVRGGISADGRHGFTFGYMTVSVPDSANVELKYMSYWVKKPEGWRVVAYKRAPRPPGDVPLDMMPPAVPERLIAASSDSSRLESFARSLDKAERDFSDEAQIIGLAAAFAKNGSADAVNMGGRSPSFIVSAEAIGRSMSESGEPPLPSPLSWAPERVIVASSGDLGITIGVIRGNQPEADNTRAAFAFFTIWRRATPGDRWLYVAE